jgi:acyl carrier protein
MNDSEIYENVRSIIMDALAVEADDITPGARLTDDLGAESIDYLDIFFQIEKKLGIRIEVNERVVNTVLNDEQFVRDGWITDDGLEELRRQLPSIDLTPLEEGRDVRRFTSIFTVEGITNMVKSRLAANEAAT